MMEGGFSYDDLGGLDAMGGGSGFEGSLSNAASGNVEAMMAGAQAGAGGVVDGEGNVVYLDMEREYEGEVCKYFVQKGYGYIRCDDIQAQCGRDVYVHSSVLSMSKATVGSKVRFKIHLNKTGMPQAQGPMTVLEGGSQPQAQYRGYIKSFSVNTGYGFVESPELKAQYGRDAYLLLKQAEGYAVGQDVFFNVVVDDQGRPGVSEMFPAFGSGMDAKGAGKVFGGKACGGKGFGGKGGKATWSAPAAHQPDPNWTPPAAFARFSSVAQQVLQQSQQSAGGCGPRTPGVFMQNAAAMNGGGMPVGGMAGMSAAPAASGWTQPAAQAAPGWTQPALQKRTPTPEENAYAQVLKAQVFEGVVTTFDMKTSRGWIACDEIKETLGTDCYVHQNVMAASGAFLGARVQFKVHLNAKGQPQAQAPLSVIGGDPPSGYYGKVKSFSDASGYGFVSCDETFAEYQRDVFLRKEKAQGYFIGQDVIFNFELTPDGKPGVTEIWPVQYHEVGKAGGRVIGDEDGKGKGGADGKGKGKAKGQAYSGKGEDGGITTSVGGTKRINLDQLRGGAMGAGGAAWTAKQPRLF